MTLLLLNVYDEKKIHFEKHYLKGKQLDIEDYNIEYVDNIGYYNILFIFLIHKNHHQQHNCHNE